MTSYLCSWIRYIKYHRSSLILLFTCLITHHNVRILCKKFWKSLSLGFNVHIYSYSLKNENKNTHYTYRAPN